MHKQAPHFPFNGQLLSPAEIATRFKQTSAPNTKPPSKPVKKMWGSYLYNGRLLSIRELAEASGFTGETVRRRIANNGIESGSDVTAVINQRSSLKPKSYIYKGQMMTVTEIVSASGLCDRAVRQKIINAGLNHGDDATDAIKRMPSVRKIKYYEYQGELLSIRQITDAAGVGESKVRRLIKAGAVKEGGSLTALISVQCHTA